jgi:hypothetical protein
MEKNNLEMAELAIDRALRDGRDETSISVSSEFHMEVLSQLLKSGYWTKVTVPYPNEPEIKLMFISWDLKNPWDRS